MIAMTDAATEAVARAMKRAERKLAAYVGVCRDDKELTETVLPLLRAAITAHFPAVEDELHTFRDAACEAAQEPQAMHDALTVIKAIVCGDKHPNWGDDSTVTRTRMRIADIVDHALASGTDP